VAVHTNGPLRTATVNGTELAWNEQGSGTPVVFVHGAGADLRTWGYQLAPVAAASFRAIAYSRRFHHPNATPAPGASYTAALHADDLAAFIGSLGGGAAHVVASSYGGAVALLLARDRPALVRGLVLTEPAVFSLLPPGSPEATQVARFDYLREVMTRGDGEAALRLFVDLAIGPGAYQLAPQSTRQMLADNLPSLRLQAASPVNDPPFSCDDAGRVKAPVLLVSGGSSPSYFKAITARLAECLPSVVPVTVTGAAHAVHAQQTARFNELIVSFLQEHRFSVLPPPLP
jgi:pimeloyl-ACP methyl ester carboxylesterase